MSEHLNVLIVSKGHPYDHTAFLAMFEPMAEVETTLVEHPAAQTVLAADSNQYDAVLFYDMCGIPGAGLHHDRASAAGQPAPDYAAAISRLLERGTGLVLLNHATVSWPNWPLWRAITGSPFLLAGGELNGGFVPGSGYRGGHGPLPNPTFRLSAERPHPVLEGLGDDFEITDELYLKTDNFGPFVHALLRADFPFTAEHFSPPPLAPAAERADWQHPPGTSLVVWANACGHAPIVVSELGDGPAAYANTGFRRLVENSLRWVATEDARQWAVATTSAAGGTR